MFRSMTAVSALLATLVGTSPAEAAVGRAFVASYGADANTSVNCGPTAPCRTLSAALSVVSSGGEVIVLDSAGYGPVPITITQSVSVIAAPGATARVTASGNVTAITVNGAGIRVILDGLAIIGSGGATGIFFQQGASLSLHRIEVTTNGNGVVHNAGSGILAMADSVLRGEGGSFGSQSCFIAQSATATTPVFASIDNTRAESCYFGFLAHANSFVSIQHSSAAGAAANSGACYSDFIGLGDSTGTGTLFLDDVHATNCYGGVLSGPLATGGNASVTVSNSFITGNSIGMGVFGASTGQTFGNNRAYDNTFNLSGSYTSETAQ
jgi:hypothetical protein